MTTLVSPPAHKNEEMEQILHQQQRELAILKAIIQAVSASHSLKEMMETALDMVLSMVHTSTGWICLMSESNSCSAFVGYKGLCFPGEEGEPPPCLAHCVCSRVRTTGEVVIVRKLKKGCPLLEIDTGSDPSIVGHVSVPLTTQSRLVGQLNVAFGEHEHASKIDIDLLKTIGPQLAVAIENARLLEEVQEEEELRKALLQQMVAVQEEERRRISRELHDELGQQLTSLLVRLQLLENQQAPQPAELVGGMKETVSQLMTSIHDLSLELRPTSLDDLGLAAALEQYARSCPAYLGIEVDFEAVGLEKQRVPREVESTLYRIVQESLTNVARHSKATQASVLLKRSLGAIIVIIEDNGVGFDPKEVHSLEEKKHRLGLYSMEERAELLGGKMIIESALGAGTSIYVEIPCCGKS